MGTLVVIGRWRYRPVPAGDARGGGEVFPGGGAGGRLRSTRQVRWALATRRNLAGLPADERAEIEQASAALRKARIAGGRALLPLTVLTPGPGDQR
jgi:hypothetical protein